jgi:hypothetical protein
VKSISLVQTRTFDAHNRRIVLSAVFTVFKKTAATCLRSQQRMAFLAWKCWVLSTHRGRQQMCIVGRASYGLHFGCCPPGYERYPSFPVVCLTVAVHSPAQQ